jgi:hypothetical protein
LEPHNPQKSTKQGVLIMTNPHTTAEWFGLFRKMPYGALMFTRQLLFLPEAFSDSLFEPDFHNT